MIDVHSHIIFGVDDGPSIVDESLRMIEKAIKAGIKVVIATPHFQKDLFETERIIENYHKLYYRIANFDLTLLLGYEVFMNPIIPDLLAGSTDLTMNGSRYILIELPFDVMPAYTYETVFKLQLSNMVPIIAHPERIRYFVKNFYAFLNLVERGCLIQIDAASVIGVYGRQVKEFAKRLIKMNMVHFVASDAHYAEDYEKWYSNAYLKISQWKSEEYADELFSKNAKVMLNDLKGKVFEFT